MKRKFIVPVRYVLIALLLPVGACHKFIDWKDVWHKNKPDCRIEKIIAYRPFGDPPSIAEFSYNAKGDPTWVIFDQAATGRPHLRFHYDNKGRLAAYTGPYSTDGNGNYEFYYKYFYDSKNRIIADSLYGLGDYIDGVPQASPRFKSYATYEYDAFDRVKKVSRQFINPGTFELDEYTYNNEGNMATHHHIFGATDEIYELGSYDDKINMNHTNKVWLFVHRDYSRSNSIAAAQYNKSNLPVRYTLPYGTGRGFLYQYDISDAEIFYHCKK